MQHLQQHHQHQQVVDKAKGFLDAGLPSGISKFEEKYGQWSIFGSKVADAADHGIGGGNCYTGNNFSCASATIDFFGGSGEGASGKVILGSFISKFDKDDLFGTISRTASIMGVEITNPDKDMRRGHLFHLMILVNKDMVHLVKQLLIRIQHPQHMVKSLVLLFYQKEQITQLMDYQSKKHLLILLL